MKSRKKERKLRVHQPRGWECEELPSGWLVDTYCYTTMVTDRETERKKEGRNEGEQGRKKRGEKNKNGRETGRE